MIYRRLGRTELEVSVICLGSMTWGEQNTEAETHRQIDYAFDHGVNFIDTAEMYAAPPRAETQGASEACIGGWLKSSGKRDKVIIATKIIGPSDRFPWIRDGTTRFDRRHVAAAVEASLRRLETDYIDLYQLHWPARRGTYFGGPGPHQLADDDPIPIEEQLAALEAQIKAGKIRYVGLSNETPWGMLKFIETAARNGLPRIASIQNRYNLLNRSFEVGHAEIAMREDCGLLAYSPMAGGALSGKYLGGARPPGSRLALFGDHFTRYDTPRGVKATEAYVRLARRHGLDPAQMALAFVHGRGFLTATIIGATTMGQLERNIASIDIALPDDLLAGIQAIHDHNPNPAP
ncbi:MAG: aldo/keto reductase [Kiloniellales bacterium]